MYKLLNMADFYSNEELEKEMKYFSKKYGFDGYELIKFTDKDESKLKDYFIGYHIRFFPSWMEFYLEDFASLYSELKDKKYFKSLCGGENSKDELVNYFKKELEIAKTLEVKYIVFHACNIKIIESLTYNFKYSDMEVLKNINYKNTGFILDTGHMINNNPEIKNSKEAVKYIKKNLENIGEYKKYILGMHLNYSLSGSYVKKTIEKNRKLNLDIHECMKTIYEHINNIDYHDPFEDKEIINVINSLPIEYLVFELIGNTKEELEDKIQRQWKIFE